MRVTNAPASRRRRKRIIKAAKGYRLKRSKLYRYASDAVDHARQYAYRDRKTKKRIYRELAEADGFETFLNIKHSGTKRFGLDGGESLIPGIETRRRFLRLFADFAGVD